MQTMSRGTRPASCPFQWAKVGQQCVRSGCDAAAQCWQGGLCGRAVSVCPTASLAVCHPADADPADIVKQAAAGQLPYCCPPCRAGELCLASCNLPELRACVLGPLKAQQLARLSTLLLTHSVVVYHPHRTVFESESDYLMHQGTSEHLLKCRQLFTSYTGGYRSESCLDGAWRCAACTPCCCSLYHC